MKTNAVSLNERIQGAALTQRSGRVERVAGPLIWGRLPDACVGDHCRILDVDGLAVEGQIAAVERDLVTIMPFGNTVGIGAGHHLILTARGAESAGVGGALLGRIVDAFGRPLDAFGPLDFEQRMPIAGTRINPMQRPVIDTPFKTGITAIDAFASLGVGQKIGVFAGSGVGKTSLVEQLAAQSPADVTVVAMIGERGREVRQIIEQVTQRRAQRDTVFVVATVDEAPIVRVRAAHYAMTVAEFFRESGTSVLLLMDSLTRFAMAQREIGLAAGEPPTMGAYTPSVFVELSRIVERVGRLESPAGAITAVFSVLVEGDDLSDPLVDNCRAILDGSIVLSRELAQSGQFPAFDIARSNSRVQDLVLDAEQLAVARAGRQIYARYREAAELREMGVAANDLPEALRQALQIGPGLLEALAQRKDEAREFNASIVQVARAVAQA